MRKEKIETMERNAAALSHACENLMQEVNEISLDTHMKAYGKMQEDPASVEELNRAGELIAEASAALTQAAQFIAEAGK